MGTVFKPVPDSRAHRSKLKSCSHSRGTSLISITDAFWRFIRPNAATSNRKHLPDSRIFP
jgi:hypothetical protein